MSSSLTDLREERAFAGRACDVLNDVSWKGLDARPSGRAARVRRPSGDEADVSVRGDAVDARAPADTSRVCWWKTV
jgi:hypothetical protein